MFDQQARPRTSEPIKACLRYPCGLQVELTHTLDAFEVFKPGVGHVGIHEVELAQFRQRSQVDQSRVTDACEREVEGLEVFETGEMD